MNPLRLDAVLEIVRLGDDGPEWRCLQTYFDFLMALIRRTRDNGRGKLIVEECMTEGWPIGTGVSEASRTTLQ